MSNLAFRKTFGQRQGSIATLTVFFVSPLMAAVSPRLSWLCLSLIACTLVTLFMKRGGAWRELLRADAAFLALISVAAYAMISAMWAADAEGAIGKSGVLLAVLVVAFAASRAMAALDDRDLRAISGAFVSGALLGSIFVAIEVNSGGAITTSAARLLNAAMPDLASKAGLDIEPMRASAFRQNVATVTFMFWPALLAVAAMVTGARRVILIGLFVLAVSAAVFSSARLSSQVAFAASLIVFPIAWGWPRIAVRSLAALWCAAFVLVLPADLLAYRAGLHMADWMPDSARARTILWQYTAERTLESPWLGVGADSTATVEDARGSIEKPEGYVYARKTGRHAHKLFLQVWYELGVFGALLALVSGALMALRILRLPSFAQPFGVAAFTTFCVTVTFAWSIWQTWLVCAVATMALYLLLAARSSILTGIRSQVSPRNFESPGPPVREAYAAADP